MNRASCTTLRNDAGRHPNGRRKALDLKPQISSPTSNVTPIKRNSPGVPTHWAVEHACSHRVDHDLSNRPADKRAGFARWLASKDCTGCWKAARDTDSASKEEWLATKRAAEQEAAAAWATQFDMPPLEGPAKTLDWGERSRHQLMTAAHTMLVVEGPGTRRTGRNWRRRPAPSPGPAGGSTSATPRAPTCSNFWRPQERTTTARRTRSADKS